jgi:hypothetical protein
MGITDTAIRIDNLSEDTNIQERWTLRKLVALMDRFKGISSVVDIFPTPGRRRSIDKFTSHFGAVIPEREQWTMQYLACSDGLKYHHRYGRSPNREIWKIYIAHDHQPRGRHAIIGKEITAANLTASMSRIRYVVAPRRDISDDLDAVERVLDDCDKRLSHIAEWIRLNLVMRVKCACGRYASIQARESFASVAEKSTTRAAIARLRCKACGKSNVIETTPFYSNGREAGVFYGMYDTPALCKLPKLERVDELYQNLGGDGENSVYAGDGLYVSPSGRIQED